jgi:hypothetical protein
MNFRETTVKYIKDILRSATFGSACFIAWLTHIFTCFAQGLWGFLIAGAIMFPVGILHGFYLWFN